MLVSSKEMILDAYAGKYAVGAFNIENMEMAIAAIHAASDLNSPIILQTTPGTLKYADTDQYFATVKALADKVSIPVAIHLDHGDRFALVMKALRSGYTSIMIDGSHLSFEENISLTKRVVASCKPMAVPVEAELGKVGGKEDGLDGGNGNPFTNPDEAISFVKETGVDYLAVAFGTIHGIYKGQPNLDLNLLQEINSKIAIPLVMHGTSGVDDAKVRQAIKFGIAKVNYATDLRIAYTKGVRMDLMDATVIDPKKYGQRGMDYVYKLVAEKIKNCGSDNKG